MNHDWKKDPRLQSLDPIKLQMLQTIAEQGKEQSISDILPFLMSAAASGKQNGLQFTNPERQLILEVLKQGKSPAELAKLEKIISLMSMIR